jgi:hypothetical protein
MRRTAGDPTPIPPDGTSARASSPEVKKTPGDA